MGIFSSKESDAIKQIDKINRRLSTIREMMRQSPDDRLTRSNIQDAALILCECEKIWNRYQMYLHQMDFMQKQLFMGATVRCWNGKQVGVFLWEQYFKEVFSALTNEVRRLG
jgi:hypothetical protein